jgi:hypothetical protein
LPSPYSGISDRRGRPIDQIALQDISTNAYLTSTLGCLLIDVFPASPALALGHIGGRVQPPDKLGVIT